MTQGTMYMCTQRTWPVPTAASSESAAPGPWTGKTSLSDPAPHSAPRASTSRTRAAIRPDGRLVAIRTYAEIYTFVPGEGGRLMPSGRPVCNITGLEVQGEAIDFLDDSTFVLTSEADRRGRGSIHTVRCPE